MSNNIEGENGLLGTIWGSNLNANLIAVVVNVKIKFHETVVSYKFLNDEKIDACDITRFTNMFTELDIRGIEIGSKWQLKSDKSKTLIVKGYEQSFHSLIIITDTDLVVGLSTASKFSTTLFLEVFEPFDAHLPAQEYVKHKVQLPIYEMTYVKAPGFFGIDMAADDKRDCSLVEHIEKNEHQYYFVAFDYKKPGKRGYGKGSISIALSIGKAFNVMYSEKLIAGKLLSKGIKNRGVCISAWQSISKQEYSANDN